jgi:uncharacterized protein
MIMMRHCVRLLAATSALLVALTSHASEVPYLAGRVNDVAKILSASTNAELELLLKAHEDSTSNQVSVLIVQSLEGESLEEFSIKVAETWKLGQKGKDNGVLLLVAKDDRKVRIEVGRGLEGDLTDQTCGAIIRHEILPRFRDGDFDAGVRGGVLAILEAIKGTYKQQDGGELGDTAGRILGFLFFLVIVGIFTAVALFAKGFMSWFLYVFLLPFWGVFPAAMLGPTPGLVLFGLYAIGFLVFKFWLQKSVGGTALLQRMSKNTFFASSTGGSWSSSGSSGSSSGSSFSGGGGSFGGGGSSGGW